MARAYKWQRLNEVICRSELGYPVGKAYSLVLRPSVHDDGRVGFVSVSSTALTLVWYRNALGGHFDRSSDERPFGEIPLCANGIHFVADMTPSKVFEAEAANEDLKQSVAAASRSRGPHSMVY